jgi:hypothetical protein
MGASPPHSSLGFRSPPSLFIAPGSGGMIKLCPPGWNFATNLALAAQYLTGGTDMGRGILLWLIGVPIPIILLIALFAR